MSGFRQKRRKRPELNLVPLIDVLVMLIFFAFVTMQFRSATVLKITLPKITTAGKEKQGTSVTIAIDESGVLTVNGNTVSEEELTRLLKQLSEANKNIPVVIRADEKTQLKKLAFVMDACRTAGLEKFSLQAR
jgi:biopolymer transport protein ExbD